MDVGGWRGRLRAAAARLGCSPVEVVALAVLVVGALAVLGVLWVITPADERPGVRARTGSTPAGARADASAEASQEGSSQPSGETPLDGEAGLAVTDAEVVVHVTGAVASPGLYQLPGGARIADALEAAGGPAPEAVLDTVNLARAVTDGEQVAVPDQTAVQDAAERGGAGQRPDGKIDLNRASSGDLEELPGVGPVLAERVIGHREANGPFAQVTDLLEVSGIGQRTLEAIEELVTT